MVVWWLGLLLGWLLVAAQNATSKFKTVPGPYEDLVDSQYGQAIVPLINVNASDFVIGTIMGLTKSPGGPVNIKGVQRAVAFECAVAALNANATANAGKKYYYQMVNDGSSAAESMNAAVYLLNSGVQVVVGASNSDTTLAAASLLTSFNVTLASPSASSVLLNNQQIYPSFLRFGPSDLDQAAAIADTMTYFNWSLVTPIYTNDPYGLSGQSQFVLQAQNNKILLTCGRVIQPGQLNGIQDTIRCLSNSDSSVVMLWMDAENASNVIAALYNASLTTTALDRLTFIATDAWSNYGDFDRFSQGRFPQAYMQGSLEFSPRLGDQSLFSECLAGVSPATSDIPNFQAFWETTFRCRYNDPALPTCPTSLAKRSINGTCACDGSENLQDIAQENAVAYYHDAVFAIGEAFSQIKNNCTGLNDAVGGGIDYCATTNITSGQFEMVLAVTQFYGATGQVSFNGANRANLTYEIRQRSANGTNTVVGYYDGTNVTISSSTGLDWKDGQLPVSMIVPQQVSISSPMGVLFTSLTILALIVSLVFSFLIWYYRDEKVVKKTSPFFSQLILVGIDLCLISQIFWTVTQSGFTCFIKIWLLAIGFGLIMGNLLAKTYRIFKIFTNVQVTQLVMKDTDLLKFSIVIIAVEVLLLCVYCFVGGSTPQVVYKQSLSDSLLLIIECAVPSQFIQLFGTISLLVFNGLLILCGVVIAYVSRHVESSFNESQYIAITVYIYLLVIIILLPLYYTAGDSSSSVNRQYILRNLSVLAAMYFTLAALFVPKIYNIYKTKKEEERKRRATETSAASGTGRRRIVSTFGSSQAQGARASQTDQEGSLFARMLTSQGSQGGGGSVSFGGAAGGTVGSSVGSDDGTRRSSVGDGSTRRRERL